MMIVTGEYGRIGNALHRYAHLLAFSLVHRVGLLNMSFTPFAPWFEGTATTLVPGNRYASFLAQAVTKTLAQWLPTLNIGWDDTVEMNNPIFLEWVKTHPAVVLDGYHFKDHTSLKHHADEIRRFFAPIAAFRKPADEQIAKLRADADFLLGVVVRHGDYKEWQGGRYYFETPVYIAHMIKFLELTHAKKPLIVVCSDQPQEAATFEPLPVWIQSGHQVSDLYTLSQCDMILSPPSSFSDWSAFYGDIPLLSVRGTTDHLGDHLAAMARSGPHKKAAGRL